MTALHAPPSRALAIDLGRAKIVGDLGPCVLWWDIDGRKVPVDILGKASNPLDPKNQMPFATAAAHYTVGCAEVPQRYSGIGIVLTGTPRSDGLILTALDYDAKGDIAIEERARRHRVAEDHTALFNSFTETSVSMLGQHIFIYARPIGRNLKLGDHGEIEVFQDKRFIALTGQLIGAVSSVEARVDELDQILASAPKPHRPELRLVAGLDFDPATFGALAERFQGLPVENDLGAGIHEDPPSKDDVARWCDAIMRSLEALSKLGSYEAWVNTLGFPLARLANEQQDAGFYHDLFMKVSAAAPNFEEAEASKKWNSLLSAVTQERDLQSSWRSLRHFARQHGYAEPLPPIPAPQGGGGLTFAGNLTPDPLRFTSLPLKDAVARINSEFFVLRSSGKIYRQDADGDLSALSKQDFKTALGGRWVEIRDADGKPKRRPAPDAWLEAPDRREFHGFQYCPNNVGLKPNCLNLFTGWGDVTPATGDCSIVIDHFSRLVAGGHQAKADFLLNWSADILQNPTRKPGVCIALRGPQGGGKSVTGAILRKVLGSKNVLIVNDKDRLLGRFNSSLINKILVIGEEIFFAGDRTTFDKLKHFITGQTLPSEFKFGDSFEIESYHRLLLTSNHEQVFQAAGEERRFVIYDVSDARRGDADYFDRLYAVADGRDDATAAAFKKFLLDRDLTAFKPWKEQQRFAGDAALTRQKQLSLSAPLAWLREVTDTVVGQGPSGDYDWIDGLPHSRVQQHAYGQLRECRWPPQFSRRQALDAFRDWANKAKPFGASEYTGSPERFWAEVHKVIPLAQTHKQTGAGVRTVMIDLTDLEANFTKYLSGGLV